MVKKSPLEDTVPGHPAGDFIEEYCTKPSYDEDGVQSSAGIGLDGKEYGDPTPMEPPAGVNAPPDLMQLIKTMVHNETFNRRLDEEGFDTFEEAGDYDMPEDHPDPLTPHEALFYPPSDQPHQPRAAAVDPPRPIDPPAAVPGTIVPPADPAKPSTST